MSTDHTKRDEINWWKQKAQELRVQLHLGVSEAADQFEKQKADVGRWAQTARKNIENDGSESARKLKTKLEELEVQAALGKAETKELLSEQRKILQQTIADAQELAGELAKDVDIRAKHFGEKAHDQLDHWHTKLDLLKLQLHLGARDASDEWEERKGELKSMISNLDDKIDELSSETSESWKEFKADVSETWEKMKHKLS